MKHKRLLTVLSLLIAIFSSFAAAVGIFSDAERGPHSVISVRGKEVILYGKGAYAHMSAEVAPQGIAQDYVTLFIAVPLLLITLYFYRKGSIRAQIALTGIIGYFLITYLFFTLMAMYNQLFLLWVILLSLSFHAFCLLFSSLDENEVLNRIKTSFPRRFTGIFLIVNSLAIALLWLSIVLPSAFDGSIPLQTEHYTTLVVQALDLAIALPAAFIAGYLLLQKQAMGYKLSLIYVVFLSLLMTALTAKVIAMGVLGYNIIPVVFIIPAFTVLAIIASFLGHRAIP